MNILLILVPAAVGLAATGIAAFIWAVRAGQFDDVDTPAIRMLIEEDDGPNRPETQVQQSESNPDSL